MNSSIELLQQQLTALQNSTNPVKATAQEQVSTIITLEDVRKVVKDEIAAEISSLKSSLTSVTAVNTVQTPSPTAENQKELTLLEAIGTALTTEEQLWLSKPDKLQNIEKVLPNFFLSEDGKLAIQSFMIYYRGLYEN